MPAQRSLRPSGLTLAVMASAIAILALAGAPAHAADTSTDVNVAVAPANCGPGSRPETGLQGQVPVADRVSGRSKSGYQ